MNPLSASATYVRQVPIHTGGQRQYGGATKRDMITSSVSEAVSQFPKANGLALVVSNDYKNSQLLPLAGAHNDSKAMSDSLSQLNFAVVCRHNVKKRDLVHLVEDVTSGVTFPASYRRIIFAFSGHGARDNFLCTQEAERLCIIDLLEMFLPIRAPHLADVPKLFFIDACRGDRTDPGVPVARGNGMSVSKGGSEVKLVKLPSHGNFLLAYSTIANYQSFELEGKGGIWMTALAQKLLREDKSICDILTGINKDFTERYQDSWEACGSVLQPEFVTTLNEVVNLWKEAREAERDKTVMKERRAPPTRTLCSADYTKRSLPPVGTGAPSNDATALQGKGRYLGSMKAPSSYKAMLEQHCYKTSKPKPTFEVRPGAIFQGKVYVAKTMGWVEGPAKGTREEAIEAACATWWKMNMK